jgi:hypothetical protein
MHELEIGLLRDDFHLHTASMQEIGTDAPVIVEAVSRNKEKEQKEEKKNQEGGLAEKREI